MGRRTTRAARREPKGPSLFFIIALAIGLVLFVIVFVVMTRRVSTPEKAGTRGAIVMLRTATVT